MQKSASQTAEFRTAAGARISTKQMTQTEALEVKMQGYHIADSKELAVLKETNKEVKKLLIESWILSGEKGLSRDGPCEILENGERKPLSKSWSMLSKKKQDSVFNEFWKLPVEKRAWEYSGSGPVSVVLDYYFRYRGLGVYAYRDSGYRGWVVWVQNAREAGTPQITEAEKYAGLCALIRETLPEAITKLEPAANAEILSHLRRIESAASE